MRILSILFAMCIGLGLCAQDASTESETYGNSLISLMPFNGYGSDDVSDLLVGIAYERFTNDIMSLHLVAGLGLKDDVVQVGLGPKFYPSGHDKPVSYGLAPTFLFTTGSSDNYYRPYQPGQGPRPEVTVNQFGFMLINSMNATLSEQVYFNIEGGFGVNYVSDFEVEVQEGGPHVTGMIACRMGYRF